MGWRRRNSCQPKEPESEQGVLVRPQRPVPGNSGPLQRTGQGRPGKENLVFAFCSIPISRIDEIVVRLAYSWDLRITPSGRDDLL